MRYDIGLDIGVTSVGWAVINLDKNRIEDLGVRIFEVAENPKDGSSLATPRREARSSRRRLRRRKYRVSRVRKLIVEKGLLTSVHADALYDWRDGDFDIWLLRVNALERKLQDREFARILIHAAKHRGYKSNRKSESKEEDNGVVLSAIKENHEKMLEKGYLTTAQLLVHEAADYEGRKRNKGGQYTHVFARADLENEINIIFDKQQEFGHSFATQENKEIFLEMWGSQRPFASKDEIMNKIGECSIEKGEKRAPKFTYRFERFRALDKLNRLRILAPEQKGRPLTAEERETVLNMLLEKKEVKYTALRKELHLQEEERFNELFYDEGKSLAINEKVTFLSLEGQYKIRTIIKETEGKDAVYEYRPIDYDAIAYALTVFKDDQDIKDYLLNQYVDTKGRKQFNISNRIYSDGLIDSLLNLSFSKFSHLSLKALTQLLVHMEEGKTFKEACDFCGYSIGQTKNQKKTRLLPVLPEEEIRNPVVLRALSQSRKVINAIIKRYGSPSNLYIELAREMGRPYKERREISKEYNTNRSVNERAKSSVIEFSGIKDPRGHDILKYKLWESQDGRCAYSLKTIPLEQLFEIGYAEVDHIIPYSRSFDDGNQNKVLVLTKENQDKQNRTPYEWFGHNEIEWQKFISFTSSLKLGRKKKSLLLKTNFDSGEEEAFRERHLNDTRYITRFLKNYIEENLKFREEEDDKQRVFTVNGAYTSLMRKRWGFNKNRQENDLHHALDAAIIAVSRPFRYQVSAYFKQREMSVYELLRKKNRRFPEPWEGFSRELEARMLQNPIHFKLALESLDSDSYDDQFINETKPIFVSRMPKRGVKGQIHEATLRRKRDENEKGYTVVVSKTKLENIPFDKKTGDFAMFGKESDLKTYNAIKERYLSYGKDSKKAFTEPLYKPSKSPESAPVIRSIKIEDKRNLYVNLNDKTIADNASIVRTDVFQHEKDEKYYLLPVYVSEVKNVKNLNKFITAKRPYTQWVEKTDEFMFCFSMYPNDLIRVKLPAPKESRDSSNEIITWQDGFFYYKGTDTQNASITILSQEGSLLDRIGVQRLLTFEKYQVDPIGNIQIVTKETRHGV
ncbi:type II CRISPR RNA-guided endonuclease Cas9 [Filibacter tadaridae]|uniref:CRISPR-associated endonuclease Cas9 n=1 Tax=Filibacter tadaridae TaxID=2483811 RepID=A0A3P5X5V1_9BACL|nr:type II CRISPR RNA-guided endonuclease Cas9 [Filibacter tadaridae]VDC23599.1 CRISPR-associated endonuclease Cas9/Csn1 [Filibacter tadaridae]